ncbi:MAG: hypothetical protein BRC29_02665 [Nanohaloarchaea archaeon SW_7_43_1]|nr:MAG: hypothetical protein BRC29_02665 [Nanohaloarchaea archaeon SW_7_43_1]
MKSHNKDVSVAEATRSLLEEKPFLKELMDMDAVNYRGLARNFKEQVEEKTGREQVNLDSIVVAIRRYEDELSLKDSWTERIQRVLEGSELSMAGDIVYYTLPRERKYHELVLEAYDQIDRRSGDRIYLLQSDSEIGIVTNKSNLNLIENKVDKKDIKHIERNAAIVVLDSPEEVLEANGILSYLTEKIIGNGIGVLEMFSTYTETVFLVREEQSTQLYSTLRDLINKK